MALVEGVNKETAVAAVDEGAVKLAEIFQQFAASIEKGLANKKLTITVVLEDKQP